MPNKKSDVKAKSEFIKILQGRGYQAKVVSSPADILATKNGQTWYYEIKMTKKKDTYFGAATLTEWKQALVDPEHFRFVIAKTDDDETSFDFIEYTPEEFMKFSTIPPFKIYFNIDFENQAPKRNRKAITLSPVKLDLMSKCYEQMKQGD